jgi:chromosome segregation protein
MPPSTDCSNGSAKSRVWRRDRRARGAVEQAQARLGEIEARMADSQHALQESAKHLDVLQEQAHAIQVETLKLAQALAIASASGRRRSTPAWRKWRPRKRARSERLFVADEAIDAQREQIRELQHGDAHGAGAARAGRARLARRARAGGGRARTARSAVFAARMPQQDRGDCQQPRTGEEADRPRRRGTEALRGKRRPCRPRISSRSLQEALDHRVAREHALAACARCAGSGDQSPLRGAGRTAHEGRAKPRPAARTDRRTQAQGAGRSLNVEQLATQLAE